MKKFEVPMGDSFTEKSVTKINRKRYEKNYDSIDWGASKRLNASKTINWKSAEIDGVMTDDYPDFSDAYVSYAEYENGKVLKDHELDELNQNYPDQVHQLAHESVQG